MNRFYRAMPITADNIRPGDYLTKNRKFAIDHAITSSVYHGEDYGVFLCLIPDDMFKDADNPGEYKYTGKELLKATLVGIAKYNNSTADSEFLRVKLSSYSNKVISLYDSLKKYNLNGYKDVLKLLTCSNNIKNMLILIHPDCSLELSQEEFGNYVNVVKSNISKFDLVITNFFYSYDYRNDRFIKKNPSHDKYIELRDFLEQNTKHSLDTEMGKDVFEKIVSDILIDNENVNIYMSGGYQDLCLAQSYSNFCGILDWIIKDMNHKVLIYKPLVFYRRGGAFNPSESKYDKSIKEDWWKDLEHEEDIDTI